jgi:hypothetical protein
MIEDHNTQIAPGEPCPDEGNGPILMESGSIRPGGDGCGDCRVTRGMPAISMDGQGSAGWRRSNWIRPANRRGS